MQRGRKIVALTLAVLLVLSAMTCFTFAAPVYSALPEGYVVIDTSWVGLAPNEAFDYELGGELYRLEYGVTAFSSVDAATSAWLPEGITRTIVLAPGTYSDTVVLNTDVNLCGPYFGKSPNNKPGTATYDPSLGDWALANGRSIDPTKEAVFTGILSIGTGCNNLTVDGLAFTGAGKIQDTSRANELVEVHYNFKNLYYFGSTVANAFAMRGSINQVNRFVTIDSCRIENSTTMNYPIDHYAETLEMRNTYMGNLLKGQGGNGVQIYMRCIDINNVINPMRMVRHTYSGNYFENIGGKNFINFANRDAGSATITKRLRVRLELLDNEFYNVSVNSGTIQNQFAGRNHEFIVKNNIFRMDASAKLVSSVLALSQYYDGADKNNNPGFQHVEICGNTFYGYDQAISGNAISPYYNVYDNAAYNASGATIAVSAGNVVEGKLTPGATDLTQYGDAEILTYRDTNRIYVDLSEGNDGYYVFPGADQIKAGGTVTCTAYADEDCVTAPITEIALTEKITTAYLKVASGNTSEIYTVYIFCYPVEKDDDTSGSSECELYDLTVPGANSVVANADGSYTVTMKDNTTAIAPKLFISDKATYKFYMDAKCKYEAASTDTVVLNSKNNFFFIQVKAENGTLSDVIPVKVISNRKTATYADAANIPSYARTAVNYLNNQGFGVFGGDQNNKLNPRANITRYELAKVMVVLSGINVKMAESVKLNEIYDDFYAMQRDAAWALPYIRAATASGLIQGVADKGNLYFNGAATTTREQFTTVFLRSIATSNGTTVNAMYKKNASEIEKAFSNKYKDASKISSWALKSVKIANYYKLIQGDGINFNPNNNIIRADVAVIVYNHSASN